MTVFGLQFSSAKLESAPHACGIKTVHGISMQFIIIGDRRKAQSNFSIGVNMQAHLTLVPSGEDAAVAGRDKSIGEKFDDLWKKALASIAHYVESMSGLAEIEQSILPSEDYMAAVKVLGDYQLCKIHRELASNLRQRLVKHAEDVFAPAGGNLTINDSELREMFEYDEEKPEKYSLKAIWDFLEQTYGGQAGEEQAWRQTADTLVKKFGLKHRKEVVRKAGRAILELSVYLDDFDKKHSGKNKLSYSSGETVTKVLMELRAFATWSQDIALANDLGRLYSNFSHNRHDGLISREQFLCGDNQEIILVTYHNKFEFRLTDACASQLQLFLGMYGNLNEE